MNRETPARTPLRRPERPDRALRDMLYDADGVERRLNLERASARARARARAEFGERAAAEMATLPRANPTGDSIANPTANIPEIAEEVDMDSATEEDTAAAAPVPEPSLAHLREISSLASWTVSTYKPGCGVDALRSPSTAQFWQSDGPQPHLLNIHFFKMVSIVKLRVHLDFDLDESYTPTRMVFLAGTSMYDLTEFAEWVGEAPRGWVDIGLEGVGVGGNDVLRAMVVQVRVCENHQNGKDTHVRGVQIFARDETVGMAGGRRSGGGEGEWSGGKGEPLGALVGRGEEVPGMEEADWMGDPVVR